MSLAALIVSLISAAFSAAAVIYARRAANATEHQARAAEVANEIEQGRRLDERRPRFEASIEDVNVGGWHRLRLRLIEPESLDEVSIEIVEGHGVRFPAGQYGVEPGGPSMSARQVENLPLRPGSAATWRIELDEDRSTAMHLQVSCRNGGDSWLVAVQANLPKPEVAPWAVYE